MAEEKKPAAKAVPKTAAAKPAAKAVPKTAAAKPAAKAAAPKATAAKTAAPKTAAPKAAAPKTAAAKPAAEKAEPKTAAAKPAVKVVQKAAVAPKAKKSTPKKTDQEKADRSQILKLHHLRPAKGAKKEKTRKGLGEGSKGKTAGRGTKGTGARTTVRLGFEGGGVNLVMRTPKLRGFKNPFRVEYQVVNLEKLSELYPTGGAVTVSDLVSKGAVRKGEPVKVLGNGDISVKLDINVDKVSASAKTKVEAAGGSVNA